MECGTEGPKGKVAIVSGGGEIPGLNDGGRCANMPVREDCANGESDLRGISLARMAGGGKRG